MSQLNMNNIRYEQNQHVDALYDDILKIYNIEDADKRVEKFGEDRSNLYERYDKMLKDVTKHGENIRVLALPNKEKIEKMWEELNNLHTKYQKRKLKLLDSQQPAQPSAQQPAQPSAQQPAQPSAQQPIQQPAKILNDGKSDDDTKSTFSSEGQSSVAWGKSKWKKSNKNEKIDKDKWCKNKANEILSYAKELESSINNDQQFKEKMEKIVKIINSINSDLKNLSGNITSEQIKKLLFIDAELIGYIDNEEYKNLSNENKIKIKNIIYNLFINQLYVLLLIICQTIDKNKFPDQFIGLILEKLKAMSNVKESHIKDIHNILTTQQDGMPQQAAQQVAQIISNNLPQVQQQRETIPSAEITREKMKEIKEEAKLQDSSKSLEESDIRRNVKFEFNPEDFDSKLQEADNTRLQRVASAPLSFGGSINFMKYVYKAYKNLYQIHP